MNQSIIITEVLIVKKFRKICVECLNPDQYSFLVDEIIPQIKRSRKTFKNDSFSKRGNKRQVKSPELSGQGVSVSNAK